MRLSIIGSLGLATSLAMFGMAVFPAWASWSSPPCCRAAVVYHTDNTTTVECKGSCVSGQCPYTGGCAQVPVGNGHFKCDCQGELTSVCVGEASSFPYEHVDCVDQGCTTPECRTDTYIDGFGNIWLACGCF